MAFTFMDIQKVKTSGQLTAKYNHNCRKVEVDNADPSLAYLNEDLVQLPVINGKELNYREAFEKRIDELPYYKNHNYRSDQVKMFEVLLTYSKDENINKQEWKDKSLQWLKKTFDIAPDKQSNIMHVAYHADETGNVHCHAMVVPIDERGHLNARRWTNGSRSMTELQSSYAESVKDLGLKRGLSGSSAKHKDIRRMYAGLNRVIEVPEVNAGETALEYRERILEDIKTAYASAKKDIDDKTISQQRKNDEDTINARNAIQNELNNTQKELKNLEKNKKKIKSNIVSYEEMLKELSSEMAKIKTEIAFVDESKEKIEFYDELHKGIAIIEETNPEDAEILNANIDFALQAAKEYEERKILYEDNEEEYDY